MVDVLDFADHPYCRNAWDVSKLTSLVHDDLVETWTDFGPAGIDGTATGTARGIYKEGGIHDKPYIFLDRSMGHYYTFGTPADWRWLHDGRPVWGILLARQTDIAPTWLNPILDTTGTGSGAQVGFFWALDNRPQYQRVQQQMAFCSRGGAFNYNMLSPQHSCRPGSVQIYEIMYAGNSQSSDNSSCKGWDAGLFTDGMGVAYQQTVGTPFAPATTNPAQTLTFGKRLTEYAGFEVYGLWLFEGIPPLADRHAMMAYLWQEWRQDYTRIPSPWGYHHNPGVCKRPDGSLLLTYAVGAQHDHRNVAENDLPSRRYVDCYSCVGDGWTWSPLHKEQTGSLPMVTAAQTMLAQHWHYWNPTTTKQFIDRSADGGDTWERIDISDPSITGFRGGRVVASECKPLQIPDGRILMTLYGFKEIGDTRYSVSLIASDQDGVAGSWHFVTYLVDGQAFGKSYSESTLYLVGCTLKAVLRQDYDLQYELTSSQDYGASWGPRNLLKANCNGRPCVLRTASGHWLLIGRDLTLTGQQRHVMYWSADGKHFSAKPYILDPVPGLGMHADMVEIEPGYIFVVLAAEKGPQANPSQPQQAMLRHRVHRLADILIYA